MNYTVPEAPGPTLRSDAKFVCETCCDQGVLQSVEGGCIIFHCPNT